MKGTLQSTILGLFRKGSIKVMMSRMKISKGQILLLRSMRITFCRNHRWEQILCYHKMIKMIDKDRNQRINRLGGNQSLVEVAHQDPNKQPLTLRIKAQKHTG